MIRIDPNNPKGIVWLASYPRSGNTWLRVFLYQLVRLGAGRPRERDEINKLERVSTWEAKLVPLFEKIIGKPLSEATPAEVMAVRGRVQAVVATRSPMITLLKTRNVYGELENMPTVNAAVTVGGIYLVRDPRDVAQSLAKYLGSSIDRAIEIMNTPDLSVPGNKTTALEVWGSWSQHVYSWAGGPDPSLLVVRYEDLIDKPTQAFTAIARHLGQPGTPAQIAAAIELSSFDKLRRQEEQHGFPENPNRSQHFFATGKAGSWREQLTSPQADAILQAHGPIMEKFGYLP